MSGAARVVETSASPALARATAARLGCEPVTSALERFPDGELRPRLGPVRGDDVYVVGSTGPPVAEHLVELCLLCDAARRRGAGRLTVVVPYFGYARQDRRVRPGEPIGARVAAEMIAHAGADRLVVVDPHAPAFEAACPVPVEILSALSSLLGALGGNTPYGAVVAPDLGAAKLAERVATALEVPVALVRKRRITGASVEAEELVGEVGGQRVVIVDDMIATGATIEAAARLCTRQGALPDVAVVATHGLFVGPAATRLERLGLGRVLVTDTVEAPHGAAPGALEICSVAPLLTEAIGRLHREEAVDELARLW